MNTPYRPFIVTGTVLIAAAAIMATGLHGLWWLVGLIWICGPWGCGHRGLRDRRDRRDRRYRRDQWDHRNAPTAPEPPIGPPAPTAPQQPDPTRDRHTAFPTR